MNLLFTRLQDTIYHYYSSEQNVFLPIETIPRNSTSIVLVPSQDVFLTNVAMPVTSPRKLRQALPYALEEQLINDVEDLHFAVGTQDKSGFVPAAVVQKTKMTQWIEQLQTAPFPVQQLLPEALALPYIANEWHLLLNNNTAIIRTGLHTGTAIELTQLKILLGLLLQENPVPQQIRLSYSEEHADFDMNTLAEFHIPIERASNATTPEAEFALGLSQQTVKFNLLQAPYILKKNQNSNKVWRWAFYTILGCAILWVLLQIGMWIVLSQKNHALETEINSLYYKLFPNASSVIDPRARITQLLNNNKNAANHGAFLNAMLAVGQQLNNQNYAVTISSIDFRNNTLLMDVKAPDFQTLDKFTNGLTQQGYNVQQSNARTEGEQVLARFTIKK